MMQPEHEEKNLERERLVFFCDAVIAIAITLLALNLKIPIAGPRFEFTDLLHAWHAFAAFFLSFSIIAVFWINHHRFYVYIKAVDNKLITFNMCWLLFIVLLPVITMLIANDFFNKPAMILYGVNVLIISYFQNAIWDYATSHREYTKNNISQNIKREYHVGCNIAMGNAVFAIAVTFLSPLFAFIILVARTFMFRRSAQQQVARWTKKRAQQKKKLHEQQLKETPKEQ